MFNALIIIEMIVKWAVVLFMVHWWLGISRDAHAGAIARSIVVFFSGVIFLPLTTIITPQWQLLLLPEALWSWFELPVYSSTPTILLVLIAIYMSVTFVRLLRVFFLYIDAYASAINADSAPECIEKLLSELKCEKVLTKRLRLVVADVEGPYTVGIVRPLLVLPKSSAEWSDGRLTRVLAHESVHIIRHDWFWKLCVDCAAIILWFMPGIHALRKRFEWYTELNADDGALWQDDNRAAYAQDMLDIAQPSRKTPIPMEALAIIRGSYCFERIATVLDGSRLRGDNPYRSSSLFSLCLGLTFWFGISAVSISARPTHSMPLPVLSEGAFGRHPLTLDVDEYKATDGDYSGGVPESLCFLPISNLPRFEEVIVTGQKTLQSTIPRTEFSDGQLLAEVKAQTRKNLKAAEIEPQVKIDGYIAIRSAIPQYPFKARQKSIEGKVIAQFTILPNGQADEIRIAMATPNNVFNQAVITAIERSLFRPASKNGRPVKTKYATQTFTFKLTEDARKKTYKPKPGMPIITASMQ